MESVKAQLHKIKQKFPGHGNRIEALYDADEDFRSLCLDYFLCVQYLGKIKKEFEQKHSAVEEYENASLELEKELNDFIFATEK